MWPVSAAARALLRGSHTAVARVDVLHSGRPVYTLDVVDGQVSTESGRAVLRNLGCTVIDPTGELSGGDVDDLLNPYVCEIAPHRGVRLPTPTNAASDSVMVPLGVFGLTSRQVSGDGSISLTGQDRAMGYQGPMLGSLAISAGTPVEVAVLRLLGARNPGVTLVTLKTGFTCGPLVYAPDIDVWSEAQELAQSVGGQLYHDRIGQATLRLSGPASSVPVATYADGDGLLLSVDRQEDSDTIRNVVVAESADGRVRAVVEDTNPSSPTSIGGRYGRRPAKTLVNQHFQTVTQARQAAALRLAYELGRSETVTFTAVPHPGLDVDDVVTVHRPRAGLHDRGLVVASTTMPLAADEPMQVACRRSVLAPDGRVFPAEEAA